MMPWAEAESGYCMRQALAAEAASPVLETKRARARALNLNGGSTMIKTKTFARFCALASICIASITRADPTPAYLDPTQPIDNNRLTSFTTFRSAETISIPVLTYISVHNSVVQ